jgi:hypothetical protein
LSLVPEAKNAGLVCNDTPGPVIILEGKGNWSISVFCQGLDTACRWFGDWPNLHQPLTIKISEHLALLSFVAWIVSYHLYLSIHIALPPPRWIVPWSCLILIYITIKGI